MGIDTNTEIISRFLPIRRRGLRKVLEKKESELLARVRESGEFPQAHDNLEELAKLVGSNDLTRKGDKVLAISGNSPKNQTPAQAIDDDPKTKYLNFEGKGSGLVLYSQKGVVEKIAFNFGRGRSARGSDWL